MFIYDEEPSCRASAKVAINGIHALHNTHCFPCPTNTIAVLVQRQKAAHLTDAGLVLQLVASQAGARVGAIGIPAYRITAADIRASSTSDVALVNIYYRGGCTRKKK